MATIASAPRPALAPAPDTQALLRALAATLASRPDYVSYTPPDAMGALAPMAPSDADCDLPAPLALATYITHLDTIRRAGTITLPSGGLGQRLDVGAALAAPMPSPPCALYGLPLGQVGVLAAPRGTGKTSLLLALASATATGTQFLPCGSNSPASNVLIYDTELPPTILAQRLYAFGQMYRQNPGMPADWSDMLRTHLHIYAMQGTTSTLLFSFSRNNRAETTITPTRNYHSLRSAALQTQPRLIVVDPARRIHDGDENDSAQVTLLLLQLESLAHDTGAAIVFAHHANKASMLSGAGAESYAARGTTAWTDNAKWQLNMQTMTQDEAKALSVPPDHRRWYVRVSLARCNLAPPVKDLWYRHAPSGGLEMAQLAEPQRTPKPARGKGEARL